MVQGNQLGPIDLPYLMDAMRSALGLRSRWGRSVVPEDNVRVKMLRSCEDIEEYGDDGGWRPDLRELDALLDEGVHLLSTIGERKWEAVWDNILKHAGNEKVVTRPTSAWCRQASPRPTGTG